MDASCSFGTPPMKTCKIARLRELQMKKWKRLWKFSEIEQMNPEWQDLYPALL